MNAGTEIVGNIRIIETGTEIIGTTAAMAGIHHQIGISKLHHTLFQICSMTPMYKKNTKCPEKYILFTNIDISYILSRYSDRSHRSDRGSSSR